MTAVVATKACGTPVELKPSSAAHEGVHPKGPCALCSAVPLRSLSGCCMAMARPFVSCPPSLRLPLLSRIFLLYVPVLCLTILPSSSQSLLDWLHVQVHGVLKNLTALALADHSSQADKRPLALSEKHCKEM